MSPCDESGPAECVFLAAFSTKGSQQTGGLHVRVVVFVVLETPPGEKKPARLAMLREKLEFGVAFELAQITN